MAYQYFPGHMTKAIRSMENDIKIIDLVIELIDARAPLSSKNPNIDTLAKGKKRLIILNKSDLSDPEVNRLWKEHYTSLGYSVMETDSKNKKTLKDFDKTISEACAEKIERDRKRGIKQRSVKAMVVGIPNVGKSTFINSVSGRAGAKTGNKPGVTRGKQWISLGKTADLLDTPGILWPKFEDEAVGFNLAMLGTINDDILDMEDLCIKTIDFFKIEYPGLLIDRFGESLDINASSDKVLYDMAVIRNIRKKGNEPDTARMALILMDEVRSGRIGRFTIERP